MSLAAGTRLGPYEIVAAIGAGGMGEVYRAKDTKLNRDVALKILPESFATDADRVARFKREAQVLASLNHPNIAAIHAMTSEVISDPNQPEMTSEVIALVMELVEGDDLSQIIGRGPVVLADALPIARQIADALEAAHDAGIVHRDLKPANIKVRDDGTVKVLDFGLAKALAPEGTSATTSAMNSPTMTARATAMGMILGTAAYMSPEQAAGKAVDKRSDLWSFGVVLLEMLTGRRTFDGETVSHVLASVLKDTPDFSALPAETPASIRKLLRRCVEKDRKKRLDSAAAARLEIDDAMSSASDVATTSSAVAGVTPASTKSHVLPWIVAGLLAVALGVVVWLWAPWRAASASASTGGALQLTPLSFEQGGQIGPVWSPDGKAVAFGARQKDTEPYQLYVRYLDSPVATRITSSPTIVQAVVQWTTAGKIIFANTQGLWSISPVGGEPERFFAPATVASMADRKLQLAGPGSILRDGSVTAALYRSPDVVTLWIAVANAEMKPYEPAPFASRNIFNTPSVIFSPDGKQILLLRNAGEGEEAWLMPYPGSAANPPRRILPGVSEFGAGGTPTASWMPDNRHVVLSATSSAAPRQLYLADTVSGTLTVISSGTTAQTAPAVSPDGSRLAFVEVNLDRDIVSVDLATAVVTPVIATQRSEQTPAWAAREPAMVYVTDRNGQMEIWLQKPGQPDRPIVTPRDFPPGKTRGFSAPALSPDGTRVIYYWTENGTVRTLWMSSVAGGAPVRLLKTTSASDSPGSWSPDGNWYVYRRLENGQSSVMKVKTTGGAEPEVLDAAATGSWVPVWSPAGDWILYGNSTPKLISPDGKTTSAVSPPAAIVHAFSADGRTIYGMRQPAANGPVELFSVGVAGGPVKIIGTLPRSYLPAVTFSPSLRLSLTPDGKSLTYSIVKTTANLWLMDGLKSVTER